MSSDWKTVLYEYIRRNNELEIEGTVEQISGIRDERYLQSQQKRLNRLADEQQDRRLTRIKNELRLKLLDAKVTGDSVYALCKMRRHLHYVQEDQKFKEERIEFQHIQLRQKQGDWSIVKVDPLNCEAAPEPGKHFPSSGTDEPELKRGSQPYLNPSIRMSAYEPADRKSYDREAVSRYADTWWDYPNPEYIHFKVDCTNFVSQCLYAGGVPMDYTNRRERGWWYRGKNDQWSFSWSVANSLFWYLSNSRSVFRAKRVDSPQLLEIGDCILYDWNGTGHYGHSTVVAAKDAYGMPLVNAHTANSKHRYWDYKDSYAWSESTRYAFFHIPDTIHD